MQQQLDQLKKTNGDQQKTIDDLNTKLEAKKATQATLASATRAVVNYVAPAAYASSANGADGCPVEPKAFIYCHESGNSPGSINAKSGACGLGQALPCSKLPCSLSDYACQDTWFSTVYLARYHFSWAEAKAFWIAHSWW